jgi:hypothetical protein
MAQKIERIDEFTRHEKHRITKSAIGNLLGKGYGIKNFTVLTSENPDSNPLTDKENDKLFKELKVALKSGRYVWVEQKGHFGGNSEKSLFILNMPTDSKGYPTVSAYYAGKFEQTSFIYAKVIDGELHSYYYEKQDTNEKYDKVKNPYVLRDETVGIDNKSSADDNYSIIGKNFKYTMPFKIFDDVSEKILQNVNRVSSEFEIDGNKARKNESVLRMLTEAVGQAGYYYRTIYGKLLDGIVVE